jgi:GH25 family lysozyme M1 (1,4-beta-N-acetylmuramidase)
MVFPPGQEQDKRVTMGYSGYSLVSWLSLAGVSLCFLEELDMTTPLYVDISAWQPASIDWQAYKKWASSFDGVSRVAIRSSFGYHYTDLHFAAYLHGALSVGIDHIIFYHYAYPQFNSPESEADWQHGVVGSIRSNDVLMLDYEENKPQATADWAYRWLVRQEQNYRKLPLLYASDGYIRARLQDSRLARFPVVLADWQFTPTERPPCPPPWTSYEYLQYTDKATIPGMGSGIDANIYLGKEINPVPPTPTTPTAHQVVQLEKIWESEGHPIPSPASKIYQDWLQISITKGSPGSPTSGEYANIDWNGEALLFQNFGSVHAEHNKSTQVTRFFGPYGEIK